MSSFSPVIDLSPDHWKIVREALRLHVPDYQVVAFGSRATWTAKDYSDLDLAILSEDPLPVSTLAALREDLEESILPFRVDVIDLASVEEGFRRIINEQGIPIQRPADAKISEINISPKDYKLVQDLIKRHLSNADVCVYLDESKEDAQSILNIVIYSDLVLEQKIDDLRNDIRGSGLPFRIYISKSNDHRILSIGDCVEINYSTLSTNENWDYINYLDTGSITENQISQIRHLVVGSDKIPSRARRKVSSGDIVYSTVRPNHKHFGIIKQVPDNFIASTGFAVIKAKDGVAETGFIYYFLTQEKIISKLQAIAEHSKSAYPSIRPHDIWTLKIKLPSLPKQRIVSHILGSLDDKIELNRRMNKTLEEMAQALFKSWFVDFEPVRAKMEGRDTGLPKHIDDLFPDRLVNSELGEIPEGWEVRKIGDIVQVVGGTTPSKKNNQYWKDGEINWATPKDLSNLCSPVLFDTSRKITQAGLDKIGSGLLPKGTLLLSSRAPIGYLAFAEKPVSINQGFIGVLPTDTISNFFIYCWCRTYKEVIIQYANGSTFLEISKKNFRCIPLCIPPKNLTLIFDQYICANYNSIVSHECEILNLASIRDTLLPKLISGEIRTVISPPNKHI